MLVNLTYEWYCSGHLLFCIGTLFFISSFITCVISSTPIIELHIKNCKPPSILPRVIYSSNLILLSIGLTFLPSFLFTAHKKMHQIRSLRIFPYTQRQQHGAVTRGYCNCFIIQIYIYIYIYIKRICVQRSTALSES